MPELYQTIDMMQDVTNRNMAVSLADNCGGVPMSPHSAVCSQLQITRQAAANDQMQQTSESKLRNHLKRMELLLDNASNQLRQDNQSLKQQTIFTTVSSALTTSSGPISPTSAPVLNDNTLMTQTSTMVNSTNNQQKTTNREATLEDIDTLKSVLSCPIFNRLIDIQDSLDKLTQQMQLHPSISLADFDIDENSGELILAPPIENINFPNDANVTNVATTIINNNNNNPASIMLHHHHHHHHNQNQNQQTIYNCQKQNNFNHQTEIIFDENNLQDDYHLTFNSSQFDAHQHALESLKNNLQQPNDLSLQAKDLRRDLINPTYHRHLIDESSIIEHNDSVLYSKINHSNGKCKNSNRDKSIDIADVNITSHQHHLTDQGDNLLKHDREAIDGANEISNNSTLYSAIKINNDSQQQNFDLSNTEVLGSNQRKEPTISTNQLSNDEHDINDRRQSTPSTKACMVSDSCIARQNSITPNIPPNQVQLTTLDSYSTTTIVTPVAEKLLDSDINLTSRPSCSPSTSIGSTVKLVDEGYSGASSLQSNIEKQNINGGTPLPQTRTLNSSNNNHPIKTDRDSSYILSEPLPPTKLKPDDSCLELDNLLKSAKQSSVIDPREVFSCTDRVAERLTVTLEKNDSGSLGITIAGFVNNNQDEAATGIFIKNIEPGSPADSNGNIRLSDQIIAVDGIELTGYSNKQAVEVLKKTGKLLTLELLRVKPAHIAKPDLIKSCYPIAPQSSGLSNSVKNQINVDMKSDKSHEKDNQSDSPGGSTAQPKLLQNNKPIPAPKPSSILVAPSNIPTIANVNRIVDGNQNIRQQISSARKGPAPQPPHHRVAKIALNSDEIDCKSPIPRESSDNNIIESVSGSRNKINILPQANSMMKTRAEVTINVKNPTIQQHVQTYNLTSNQYNSNQEVADVSASSVSSPNQDRRMTDKVINYNSKVNSSFNENDGNLLNSSNNRIAENTYDNYITKTDTIPMWDEKSEAQIIQLNKGNQKGLGFSVLDYHISKDAKQTVIVIRSLVPGGIADLDGRLVPGDRLLFVDDKDLRDATLEQAVKALKEASGLVSLGVLKPIPFYNSNKAENEHPYY